MNGFQGYNPGMMDGMMQQQQQQQWGIGGGPGGPLGGPMAPGGPGGGPGGMNVQAGGMGPGGMGAGGGGGNPAAMQALGADGEMIDKIGSGINNRLHNMKASYKMFQDFVKFAVNYSQALSTSAACGRQMAAVLKKVSTGQGQPDIAAGFRSLAELQHGAESRYDQVLKAMQDDLLSSAQNVLTGGFKETCRFEQGFNQGYARARAEVAALQPGSLQRQAKVREVEDKLANNLEILRGLERKVYCNFLLLWTAVLDAQTATYRAAADAYAAGQKQWTQLAVSGDRIAPEPVDYKRLLAERRGEPYAGGPGGMMNPQQQQQQQMQMQQQQQQMAFQQQQQMMMMRQSQMPPGGAGAPMRGPLGAHWGGGPPPMMMQQNFLPKGVPELPENMRGARLELQQQYKKIPKFDDLDESGLEGWELPDLQQQFDRTSSFSDRSSSFSDRSSSSTGSPMDRGSNVVAAAAAGGGGGGVPARGRNASTSPAVAAAGAKSPPMTRKKAADVLCLAKSLYAYKANNDDEHSFPAGETFEVLTKDSDNWWTARLNNVTLLVPANYMSVID
jgi:hypothetical protein